MRNYRIAGAVIIAILALVLACSIIGKSDAGVVWTAFSVDVPNGGAANGAFYRIWPSAEHVRVRTSSGGVHIRFYRRIRNSQGQEIGWQPIPSTVPSPGFGQPTVPADSDSTFTVLESAVLPWNTYNDIGADGFSIYNDGTDNPATVYFECKGD